MFAFIILNSLSFKVHGNRKLKKVVYIRSKYDVKVPQRCPDVPFFVSIKHKDFKKLYVMCGWKYEDKLCDRHLCKICTLCTECGLKIQILNYKVTNIV